MLIEFSVTNFRSIQAKQTFSMVKSALKEEETLEENAFDLQGVNQMSLLRSAAIYGANAAGKTNLLLALRAMRRVVIESAREGQRGTELPIKPFRLDPASTKLPTEFEVIFIAEGVRYQYGFSATRERVIEEWLSAFPKKQPQNWFARQWDEKTQKDIYETGSAFKGEKKLWQATTRSNALFLSTAVQLNSEQLQPVYDWFKKTVHLCFSDWGPKFTASQCLEKKNKIKTLKFLKNAGIDVDDLQVEKEKFDVKKLPAGMPEELKSVLSKNMDGEDIVEVKFLREDSDGNKISFEFEEESDGTRKLFSFAGPWLDILEKGHVLVIDELHDNLHPNLVKFLVQLFNSNKINPKNAQLIFTTHSTSILNQEVFRRDQIWFCGRNEKKSTQVYPLTDFSPRKGRENVELAYLSGRYGAVPYIDELMVR